MPKSKKDQSAKNKGKVKVKSESCSSSDSENSAPNKRPIDSVSTFNNHGENELSSTRRFRKRPQCESEEHSEVIKNGRKDEKKKLIYLSKQVYNIVKDQKAINGNDVFFQAQKYPFLDNK